MWSIRIMKGNQVTERVEDKCWNQNNLEGLETSGYVSSG